jgi:DNA-binding NarL/FixJ family response regulator
MNVANVSSNKSIAVAIADDHQLFLKSLSILIQSFSGIEIIAEALNGEELLHLLSLQQKLPEIILMDVNMPVLNGIETTKIIVKNYPQIKVVALSMKDDDLSMIHMLQAGCCAYLLKDIHPDELEKALREVSQKGYYNFDATNIAFRRKFPETEKWKIKLSDRELQFLKLACSDLTYKQIAAEMILAERTIDGYREALFQKLNVQSRVGMCLEALRRNIVTL